MIALSIEVKGPMRDLHSGTEGGKSDPGIQYGPRAYLRIAARIFNSHNTHLMIVHSRDDFIDFAYQNFSYNAAGRSMTSACSWAYLCVAEEIYLRVKECVSRLRALQSFVVNVHFHLHWLHRHGICWETF